MPAMKRSIGALLFMLLGSIPLRAQSEPILRLGGERDAAGDLFSRITDVALDPRDRVLILDDADNRIVVVGLDGRLRQTLGRRGAGPGEFAAPTAIVVTASGQLAVADAANSRLTLYDASAADSVRFIRTASMPVRAYDACAIGERIFMLADDGRHVIHEFALGASGVRRVRSFGMLRTGDSKQDDPRFRVMLTQGHLACAPGGEIVAFVAEQIGQVWTFSDDGRELAHITLAPFTGIGIDLTENGVRYVWPESDAIAQAKSLEILGAQSLRVGLVRLKRGKGESVTDRYEFRTLDLSGKVVATQMGSGRFVARSKSLTACVTDDVVPELRVYRTERSGTVCR